MNRIFPLDLPVVDGVADVLLDAQSALAGPVLCWGLVDAGQHLGRLVVPVVDALGLRRGHGGHDDGVPRPQGPVLAGLVALLPRLDAVSHDPRSVLKSEILLLT